mmetsp:Transcript_28169/g.32602  ORF Transcript_28169/g.32602 Transcript_28169/m.32602 type:complete len:209 (+) Transcript_28169:42-668(+)
MLRHVVAQRLRCRAGLTCTPIWTTPFQRPGPSPALTNLTFTASPIESRRWSNISSNKSEGYYRLSSRDITIPPEVYEVTTSRGSGPGGQGAQSSSNKVELRVRMDALQALIDEATYVKLVEQQSKPSGALTSDGTTLILTCYEHRSALKNKETCVEMLKDLIVDASWEPPVEADPIQTPSSTVSKHKFDRRKKGNMLKARSSARKGQW